MQKERLSKEDSQKIKHLIETLEQDQKSFIFLEPVDVEGLGLTDYLEIVKNPMDISTIKKKIKLNHYNSLQEVLLDLQLIWSNCKLYNQEGSEIYLLAVYMEKLNKKLIDKMFKDKEKTEKTEKTEKRRNKVEEQQNFEQSLLGSGSVAAVGKESKEKM